MALVMGAFTTLGEAERTTLTLLEDGVAPTAITATARSGGGRLLLAARVPVHAVGEPARLANCTERVGASALIGGVAGALLTVLALVLLPAVGIDPMFLARGFLSNGMVFVLEVLLGALVAAGVAALLRRTRGLPHDLAVRYAMRLDQGDTVLAVQTGRLRGAGRPGDDGHERGPAGPRHRRDDGAHRRAAGSGGRRRQPEPELTAPGARRGAQAAAGAGAGRPGR